MGGREVSEEAQWSVLSLDEHEELVMLLTSKTAPSRVSQAPGLPTHTPSEGKRSRSKVWQASLVHFNSSEDEPLSDKAGKPEPKSRKKDHTTPELMIVDDDDPLPGKPKSTGKKEKFLAYTQEELDGLDLLLLWLKREARRIQYSMETAGLTKYCNDRVPGLRGAPNTDDHSTYLSEVKKESSSYPAKGNLSTAQQFTKELEGCPDVEKRLLADKTLWEKGMPGIPQETTMKGGKWELIKVRYMMKVLWSIKGRQ